MSKVTTSKSFCRRSTCGCHTVFCIPRPCSRMMVLPLLAPLRRTCVVPRSCAAPTTCGTAPASGIERTQFLKVLIAIADAMVRPPADRGAERNHDFIRGRGIGDRELHGEIVRAH